MTTWESYIDVPWQPVNASNYIKDNFANGWHDMLFTVMNEEVIYYLDGVKLATHTVADQDGTTSVYPDSKMQIAFANLIWSNSSMGLGSSTEMRKTTMKVDWVYHAPDTVLATNEVILRIDELRKALLKRKNNLE